MKKYLIIGNGIAAVGCIEGIRSADHDGEITVVSAEERPAYYRPLISYYLEGRTTPEMMRARDEDFYERNGVKVIYSKKAVGTDTAKKQVKLSDGSVLSYDVLCFATGSSPFVPDMEGLDKVKNKHTFLTLDDALDLEKSINGNSKVLIIGAGLIGLKCAEGIRSRVSEITVCDLASRVLSSILDSDCSDVVKEHLEKNGISFLLGDSVRRFDDGIAYMKSGCEIGFDTLVLAVGVRANVSLFRDAGGETGRGIITDERMRTSLDGIYAAGDCTESLDIIDDGNFLDRSHKTALIADYPPAKRHLNVCYGHDTLDTNCSVCPKCARTLLTLELLGKLDEFSSVFDVKKYRREVRTRFIAETIVNAERDLFATHEIDLARERGIDLRREVSALDIFRARMLNSRLHNFIRGNPFLKRIAKTFFRR